MEGCRSDFSRSPKEIIRTCFQALFGFKFALLIPFGAGFRHRGIVFEHAFATFHFYVGHVAVALLEFLGSKMGGKAAPALGACCLDPVTFLGHGFLLGGSLGEVR